MISTRAGKESFASGGSHRDDRVRRSPAGCLHRRCSPVTNCTTKRSIGVARFGKGFDGIPRGDGPFDAEATCLLCQASVSA
jgi:hypothetical protein